MRTKLNFPLFLVCIAFILSAVSPSFCQLNARKEIKIPDIPGYKVLKCDFHIHTVFSDGNVWPSIRPEEAWLEGLDVIAITDHIEYLPHKKELNEDFNRSFEIAKSAAERYNIIVIKGAEITRSMPPGHINAIFLKDSAPLKTEKWEDAVNEAAAQGAFLFWNHPGWKGQQKDGVAKWYDEHTNLFDKKLLKGIEIVNYDEYYADVHKWGVDKNLAMLGNTDVHDPISMSFDMAVIKHRPMNLVFIKEDEHESKKEVLKDLLFTKDKTQDLIKEALIAGRSVVYNANNLIGKAEFLTSIFENSILIKNPEVNLVGGKRASVQIMNSSEVNYELVIESQPEDFELPETITLNGERTVIITVKSTKKEAEGRKIIEMKYKVKNLLVAPNEGLPVVMKIAVNLTPAPEEKPETKK